MKTVFNVAILLLSAFLATAEQSTFGVSATGSSVFGISRGGGLFGGKEKTEEV